MAMKTFATALGAAFAVVFATAATVSTAAVLRYDISFPTTGVPDPAELSFTLDTTDLVLGTGNDQTDGFTLISTNFDVGPVGYRDGQFNGFPAGSVIVGGLLNGVTVINASKDDFAVVISNFADIGNAALIRLTLAQDGQDGFIREAFEGTVGATLTVTDVNATVIPLPAAAPLLLSGLGGLALLRRRARRPAARHPA